MDNWQTVNDTETVDTGLHVHLVDLPVDNLPVNTIVVVTFHWSVANAWEGTDFTINIV
jgi:hypothetical protein